MMYRENLKGAFVLIIVLSVLGVGYATTLTDLTSMFTGNINMGGNNITGVGAGLTNITDNGVDTSTINAGYLSISKSAASGTPHINLSGEFPYIYFNETGGDNRLLSCDDGDIQFRNATATLAEFKADGNLDMRGNPISNIGNAGTDLESTAVGSRLKILGGSLNTNSTEILTQAIFIDRYSTNHMPGIHVQGGSSTDMYFGGDNDSDSFVVYEANQDSDLMLEVSTSGEVYIPGLAGDGTNKCVCIKSDGYLGTCTCSSCTCA